MVDIPLILPTGSTIGRDGQDANARLVNAYAESLGKDGKAPFAVYNAPGSRRWDDGDFNGGVRDLIEINSNQLIGILGNEIVSFDQAGASTLIETIAGSGRVMTSINRAATPQIPILTSSGQTSILAGGVLTPMADTDLPTTISNCYLAGFTMYGIEDGRIFQSDLENASSVLADAFGIARGDSSKLVRVFPNAGFLYAMKEKTTEIWQPDPSLAAENFSFSPVQQNIDIGLGAKFSPAALQRGLAWVDDEYIVRLGRDGAAERISSHSVERSIEDLTQAEREALYGFVHTFQGHECYVLTATGKWTWILDSATGQWWERQSYDRLGWRVNSHVVFNKMHIVGTPDNGNLYVIDPKTPTDAGETQIVEIWCAQSHRFPKAMKVDSLELDIISGTGTVNTVDESAARPGVDDEYTKVLLHFNGVNGSTDFTDESGKIWTPAGNAQIDTAESKFGGASGFFDGTGDDVSTVDHADFTLGSSNFTIDLQCKINAAAGVEIRACGITDGALSAAGSAFIIRRTSGNLIQAQLSNGTSLTSVTGTTQVTDSEWHHVAFERSGNTLNLRLNNTLEATAAFTGTVPDVAEVLCVGGRRPGAVLPWNGWLDEFRFSVGIARGAIAPTREYGSPALVPETVDPKVMVDYSEDGGHSFRGERAASIGKIGNYRQRLRLNRWGRVTEKGRIWRFRASANVLRGFLGAVLQGEALDV